MICYLNGTSGRSYADLAQTHWEMINPKNLDGSYRKTESLIGRILALKDKNKDVNLRKFAFYDMLLAEEYFLLKYMIKSTPEKLAQIGGILNKRLRKLKLKNPAFKKELLEEAFQYENWRSNGKFETMFAMMDINVCPYCNYQEVFKDMDTGNMIISCDHYLDKAKHPCLSLSFFNLIPVCKMCNESYKGTQSFRYTTHIHPYMDDFDSLSKFNNDFVPNGDYHNVFLETAERRVRNSARSFGLKSRYAQQAAKVNSKAIYYLSVDYPDCQKQQLVSTWGLQNLLGVEKHICERYGIPFSREEIRGIPYGKLKRDLALKYKLITG